MRKRFHTFQSELALVVSLVMVLFIFIFGGILYQRELRNYRHEILSSLENNLKQIKENLELEIYILNRLSYSIAGNPEIISVLTRADDAAEKDEPVRGFERWEMARSVEKILFQQTESWRIAEGILVVGNDGSAYYGAGGSFLKEGYDFLSEPWIATSRSEGPSIGYEFNAIAPSHLIGGSPALAVIRKIFNPDRGSIIGTLRIDFPLEELDEGLQDLSGKGEFSHFIFDSRGEVLWGGFPDFWNFSIPGIYIAGYFSSGDIGYFEKDGQSVFLFRLEEPDWILAYVFSSEDLFGSRGLPFFFQTLLILSLGLTAAFVSSMIISRRFSRGIVTLKKAMETAESGNLDVRVDISSHNEIEILGDSFNKMTANLKELYDKLYSAEIDTRQARINALQAWINPHFMFNTLECIDSLALVENNSEISILSRALSNNFKYAFEKGKFSTLKEEIDHTEDYIKIIQIRYPDKLTIHFEAEEKLYDFPLPRLTLQPIVENAVLHGVLKSRQKGEIRVSVRPEGEGLHIAVEDNGVGMPQDILHELVSKMQEKAGLKEKHQSGLANVNNRLKFLYKGNRGLQIESRENEGTTIGFSLDREAADNV